MLVIDELLDRPRRPAIQIGFGPFVLGRQGADDQRRAGFVDQHAVGLVDQGEMMRLLHRLVARSVGRMAQHLGHQVGLPFRRAAQQQSVAEEIETEFFGGAVGDVAFIGRRGAGRCSSA